MKFKIGDSASISKTITDADIQAFAEVTGDHNPLHLDDEYAAKTRFGRRIAHGMLSASLISAVLANELPGAGSVYLSQLFHGDRGLWHGLVDYRPAKRLARSTR